MRPLPSRLRFSSVRPMNRLFSCSRGGGGVDEPTIPDQRAAIGTEQPNYLYSVCRRRRRMPLSVSKGWPSAAASASNAYPARPGFEQTMAGRVDEAYWLPILQFLNTLYELFLHYFLVIFANPTFFVCLFTTVLRSVNKRSTNKQTDSAQPLPPPPPPPDPIQSSYCRHYRRCIRFQHRPPRPDPTRPGPAIAARRPSSHGQPVS